MKKPRMIKRWIVWRQQKLSRKLEAEYKKWLKKVEGKDL